LKNSVEGRPKVETREMVEAVYPEPIDPIEEEPTKKAQSTDSG